MVISNRLRMPAVAGLGLAAALVVASISACGGGGSAGTSGAGTAGTPPTPASSAYDGSFQSAQVDRLGALTLATFRVTNRYIVATADGEQLLASVPGFSAEYPNTVARIDVGTGSAVHSPTLPVDPWLLALSSDGRLLYVADLAQPKVVVLSVPDLAILATHDLSSQCSDTEVSDGQRIVALAASPANPNAWALSCARLLGLEGGKVVADDTSDLVPDRPATMAYSGDGSVLYTLPRTSPGSLAARVVSAGHWTKTTEPPDRWDADIFSASKTLTLAGNRLVASGGWVFDKNTLALVAGPTLLYNYYSSAALQGGCAPLKEPTLVACFDYAPVAPSSIAGVPGISIVETRPLSLAAFLNLPVSELRLPDCDDCMHSPFSRILAVKPGRLLYSTGAINATGMPALPSDASANSKVVLMDYSGQLR